MLGMRWVELRFGVEGSLHEEWVLSAIDPNVDFGAASEAERLFRGPWGHQVWKALLRGSVQVGSASDGVTWVPRGSTASPRCHNYRSSAVVKLDTRQG
jgi:hypothetical protein